MGQVSGLLAPSKTYNIPGLGCSFAVISDPTLRKSFARDCNGWKKPWQYEAIGALPVVIALFPVTSA